MKRHLHPLTAAPVAAQSVPTDVKLAFLADVFDAAAPLFSNKDPQNPLPPGNNGNNNGNPTT